MIRVIKATLIGAFYLILMGSPACEPYEELGNGYYYTLEGITSPRVDLPDIPRRILDYEYDDRFIIAKQNCEGEPRSRCNSGPFFENTPYGTDSTTFWLIDKSVRWNSGPMDATSFKELCRENGVTLDFVDFERDWFKSFFKFLFPDKIFKRKK